MDSGDEEICAALTRVAFAGDGVVLGLGVAVLAIRTWIRFWFHSKALHHLQGTPLYRIADLRSLVFPHDTGQTRSPLQSSASSGHQQHQHRHNHNQKAPFSPPYSFAPSSAVSRHLHSESRDRNQNYQFEKPVVIIRGRVSTKSLLDSQWGRKEDGILTAHNAASQKAVIVQRTQTCLYNEWRGLFGWSLDWRGLLGWGSVKEQVIVSTRKVPFVLVDGTGFDDNVYAVIDMEESKHGLPLTTIYHQLHPVQASPYTLLQAIFGRGYPVGILDEERILPPGKEITAVGILDSDIDGQPIIKSSKQMPFFLTELTREQLMADLATNTKVLLWTGLIISTCAVGVLSYALYRNWRRYTEWKLNREHQREEDRLSAERIEGDISDIPDRELCVICLLRRRRAAFLHCGHLVCCVRCAQRVEEDINARCPVCRQSVSGTVRIYDA